MPAGVFNVVTGSAGAVGNELTSNPLVRKLSFTGSTEIGRQLMEQCAKDIKKVSLELGGNAPFIVFDDADLDKSRGRRAGLEIPQRRANLRLRQPFIRAGTACMTALPTIAAGGEQTAHRRRAG
nr:aldehyde dehydrogenase family protein [Escherichia coli]